MKVIFLDFDGVLNSAASFLMEGRKTAEERGMPVNETLCEVCTSNFQLILDKVPDVKIVISSTWRELFDLDWLKAKLAAYGIDSSKVIDKTPTVTRFSGAVRGEEIQEWLDEHKEVTDFVILDDNHIGCGFDDNGDTVKTQWASGLQLPHALEAIWKLGGNVKTYDYF